LIARAKWDAWSKLGSMSKADAQRAYVDALTKSDPQWQTKAKNMKIKSKL
jgi:acyl-CoA-binding protein